MNSRVNQSNFQSTVYSCEACGKCYKHEMSLRTHRSQDCGKCLLYFCDFCGKLYKHERSLKKHQKFECGKEPQFQCPYCTKKAHQKSGLKSHILNKHPDLMTFSMIGLSVSNEIVAKRSFQRREDCIMTSEEVALVQKFKDDKNDLMDIFNFLNGFGLPSYIKHFHKANFLLKCSAYFIRDGKMYHRLKDNNKDEGREVVFDAESRKIWQKLKETLGQMTAQTAVSGDLKWKCDRCGRGYKYRQGLRLHLQFGCGKEPQFKCPYCDKKCQYKGNLKAHVYTVHKQII
ncbi:uncharacterized protein LOC142326513 [Lycorma delicatula]|uniref:uncharacterized protein LOC142326513 n=1 Tax=Lycorma delicatula TaxID=130591 RepID=UPI003F511937